MAFGQARMIEVVGWIVRHSELFHHVAGAQVFRNRERDQTVEAQLLKGVLDHRARAFCRQSATPAIECEPPADFYGGHERRVKIGNG